MPQAVAERYARALAEAAGPKADYSKVAQEIEAFAEIFRQSADLREVFDSPAVRPEQKLGVLNAILLRLGTDRLTGNFFRVLLAHYRIGLAEEIRAAFQSLADDWLGVVRVKIRSATPLAENEKTALSERFSRLTGKKVNMEYGEDAGLVAGVAAEIKSAIYDGSVRGALEQIREHIGSR
ncbi:MAG: ATP synthase F1 subunit delta [Terriglobia bacterium]